MSRFDGVTKAARDPAHAPRGEAAVSSKPTHIAVVTSRWGQRINPLTYGSRAWRECYGEADIADRRAALTASEDLRIEIREAPGRGDS